MKWILPILVVFAPQAAQSQIHAEVRGGMTIGSFSSSRAGLDIEPRVSFDVLVHQKVWRWVSAYGSYSRLSYGCAEGLCKGKVLPVTGNHGVLGGEISWRWLWARTGAMLGVASIEGAKDPKMGFGMQGALGARLDAGPVQIVPGVSMERMQSRYADASDWATALSFDLGISYALPFGFREGEK